MKNGSHCPYPKTRDITRREEYPANITPLTKRTDTLLLPFINKPIKLALHQNGFRSQHSTTTARHIILEGISNGLSQNRPGFIMVSLGKRKTTNEIDKY